MVISIFIICNLLKSWNYLLFLCDDVRLFMQFSGMLSGTGYPSCRIYPTGTGMELIFLPCAFAGNPTGKNLVLTGTGTGGHYPSGMYPLPSIRAPRPPARTGRARLGLLVVGEEERGRQGSGGKPQFGGPRCR
jgi:hypothetical protein